MFDRVDEQLADTVNALATADHVLASKVRDRDREVDAMELENDQHCIRILDSLQPTDMALRTVIASMRISSSLERVGDQCKNTCKAVSGIGAVAGWQSSTNILDIADAARNIMHRARDAFVHQDRLKARQVLAYDRQVDRAYREAFAAIAVLSPRNGSGSEALLHLGTVTKSLERIADHAKTIARCVVYFVEGTDIRYSALAETVSATATSPFARAVR